MLIKNLPKPIKELVFKRQIEQGNEPNEELMLSKSKPKRNFDWGFSPEGAQFWYEINKGNYKPFFEKYGGVILCTSVKQGAKIIDYFKSMGVDTIFSDGSSVGYYYGFMCGHCFSTYSEMYVKELHIPIFTLDELGVETTQELGWQGENTKNVEVTETDENLIVSLKTQTTPYTELPEINFEGIEMEVWDDDDENIDYHKCTVIAKINGRYLVDDLTIWDNARPIQQKVKVTKEQIAEAFNTTVELLEIE